MSIVTKKIGKREYAYLASREGGKVVHRYLGAADGSKAAQLSKVKAETTSVPERFAVLFWDTALQNINLNRHAGYIIEKVLEFGDLDAFSWLQDVYPGRRIKETMLLSRNLSARSRNFWQIWLEVKDA